MVLPSGFALPALPYLAALAAAVAIAVTALSRRRPPVTGPVVAALTPWMAAGGALYALYQAGTPPDAVAPFFGSPAVYVTVGVLAAVAVAAVADRPADTWGKPGAPAPLAAAGAALLTAALLVAAVGPTPAGGPDGGAPLVSAAILAVSVVVAAAAWRALLAVRGPTATGAVGAAAVFGHTLDGVSTAVGYDALGFAEQTPLSRLIIEAGGAVPLPAAFGDAWLFALVKVALGVAVVVLFESYVREDPREGYALLGFVTAVGLGPGAHNLVLFAIA